MKTESNEREHMEKKKEQHKAKIINTIGQCIDRMEYV